MLCRHRQGFHATTVIVILLLLLRKAAAIHFFAIRAISKTTLTTEILVAIVVIVLMLSGSVHSHAVQAERLPHCGLLQQMAASIATAHHYRRFAPSQ